MRACSIFLALLAGSVLTAQDHQVRSVEVRILSTMLADDDGFGEWGFAALIVADGHRILFDTGAHPDTVLRNVRELKVDLSAVPDVILSHNHLDHTSGLLTLRREYGRAGAPALGRVHAGKGISLTRVIDGKREVNAIAAMKKDYESTGGQWIEYDTTREIFPGVWLTGPVPRRYPERNWSGHSQVKLADGSLAEDNIPEDQSLVIDTAKGLVLISGCGHAGVINTVEYARAKVRSAPLYLALGGFHLYPADDDHLDWTAGKLKEFGLKNFVGAHCTGIEAVYRIRRLVGLDRGTAVVGAVGAGFDLSQGIRPGSIAH